VTVCIAAICSWLPGHLMIVGASDRMLTAGDIQFEPPQQKIWQFNQKTVALVAGDMPAQNAICSAAHARFALKPAGTVEEAASVYADAFTAFRRKRAETKYLVPCGLDANSFIDRQLDMRPEVVADLTYNLQNGVQVEAEAIVAGIDSTGPHIFVVRDPGDVYRMDAVSFAAIGSGGRNAEMQFMLSHYTRQVMHHKALLLTLTAKKRAEVSPGIGKHTDMFFIGDQGYSTISTEIVGKLAEIHQNLEARTTEIIRSADGEAEDFVNDFLRKAQAQQVERPKPSEENSDHDDGG